MIYVMSDLHGRYDLYAKMLKRIGLSQRDTLYILGDFVDRGPAGFRILLDAMERPNVIPLLGNHDYAACAVLGLMQRGMTTAERTANAELIAAWLRDGGDATLAEFRSLPDGQRRAALGYIDSFRYFAEVQAGGREFVLCHGGIGNFEGDKPLLEYAPEDFVFCRPDYGRVYFKNRFLVTGHTPTACIEGAEEGRVYRCNNHIAIDCGAVFGYGLGCVCLDTLEEFYVR